MNNENYREIFDHYPDGMLIIQSNHFIACNQAAVDMLKFPSKNSLLRVHPSEISPPLQPDGQNSFEKSEQILKKVMEEGHLRFEWTHLQTDGQEFPIEVTLVVIHSNNKKYIHVVWRDLSAQKQTEIENKRMREQLHHSSKLESLGALAANIIHEINNPLTVAYSGAEEIKDIFEQLNNCPKASELIQIHILSLERIKSIVQELKMFSRMDTKLNEAVDLNECINVTLKLTRSLLQKESILVETFLSPEPSTVLGNFGKFQQVFMNLLTNAKDALENKSDNKLIRISTVGREETIECRIHDSGCGISEECLTKIFEPFYTSKVGNKGTGLGLPISQSIIASFCGEMRVESVIGVGSTFIITLPRIVKRKDMCTP